MKYYHIHVLEKTKVFLVAYEDLTKAVIDDKNCDNKHETNLHVLKTITRATLLCAQQGLALRRNRDQIQNDSICKQIT